MATLWLWSGFLALVLLMLALDLGVFNRQARVITTRQALRWTSVGVALALLFNVGVFFLYEHHLFGIGLAGGSAVSGRQAAMDFFTGYVVEQSLSLDNLFVIALIFAYFRIPRVYQHRVLFWGILGALLMRGAMILAGTALIHRFHWIIYVFGGLLLVTAVKMAFGGEEKVEPGRHLLVRIARRLYPVTRELQGEMFFTRVNGRRAITPLFLTLLIVESTDVLFAVDSIPAVFAVTTDPFIVFTSNVFAILCLRSMYFALAGMMHQFQYFKISLVFVLAFVGVKMLAPGIYPVPPRLSLAIIGALLLVGVIASVYAKRRSRKDEAVPGPEMAKCPACTGCGASDLSPAAPAGAERAVALSPALR